MTPVLIILMAATILLEVAGQIAFKMGLSRAPEGPVWRKVLASPAIVLGVAAYAVELGMWLGVLSLAPLSIAFPLAALSYCGVLLASRAVLGEPVSNRRWLGASVITLGVALVCLSA
ncbi:hypothetical protein RE429_31185 (plasmid) [Microvirga sp. M2]